MSPTTKLEIVDVLITRGVALANLGRKPPRRRSSSPAPWMSPAGAAWGTSRTAQR